MSCGLFGKLPSKRDFVAYNVSRPFLDNWERWLQAAMAESRLVVGEAWQNLFLTMPIWRFWLGKDVFGQAVVGALMPSVDGVGRYFPLSLCALEPAGARLAAPPREDVNAWLDSGEHLLLAMLEEGFSADLPTLLRDFPGPPLAAPANGTMTLRSVTQWVQPPQTVAQGFAEIEAQDAGHLNDNRGFWWTLGGAQHAQQLVTTDGAPATRFLSGLMTANFS